MDAPIHSPEVLVLYRLDRRFRVKIHIAWTYGLFETTFYQYEAADPTQTPLVRSTQKIIRGCDAYYRELRYYEEFLGFSLKRWSFNHVGDVYVNTTPGHIHLA